MGNAGQKGAAFLNIAVGARAAAMGGSFVGLGDDISTMYWNPAGLVHLDGNHILISHHEWVDDLRHEFIAYGNADRRRGGLAIGATILTMGDILVTTISNPDGGCATYTASDLSLMLSYAHQFGRYVGLGFSIQRIRQRLESFENILYAVDVGYTVDLMDGRLCWGGSVQHIGFGRIVFERSGAQLPIMFRSGWSLKLLEQRAVLEGEVARGLEFGQMDWGVGGEVWLSEGLAVRGGYTSRANMDEGFTAGVGVRIRDMELSYAFIPFGVLGDSHRGDLMIRW